jgi:hypothetical protein
MAREKLQVAKDLATHKLKHGSHSGAIHEITATGYFVLTLHPPSTNLAPGSASAKVIYARNGEQRHAPVAAMGIFE